MSYKTIKHRLCFAVALICGGAAFSAEEYRWANDSVGNDVTGSYVWSDKNNWSDGAVPGAVDDVITFTNCVGGERYISMPPSVEAGKIYFRDDIRTFLVGGSLQAGTIRAVNATATVASRVYADSLVPANGVALGTVENMRRYAAARRQPGRLQFRRAQLFPLRSLCE
jgi:hypothetical protein